MNENISNESSQKFPMRPVAPLGVIAMNGCEEMGRRVNEYLMNWQVDSSSDQKLHSFYGSDKNGFLLEAHCPPFAAMTCLSSVMWARISAPISSMDAKSR